MNRKIWIASPFFQKRGNYPLDMVVIHHIGSNNGKLYSVPGTITWFTSIDAHKNPETGKIENQVSAHYILPREPYKNQYDLIQLVQDIDVAWHAGDSQWTVDGNIRKYINNYSVGIELEGDGNLVEYTDYQYERLTELVSDLVKAHNIKENNVVGHEDIAPSRKVDPGHLFDWKRLRTGVFHPVVSVPVTAQPSAPPITYQPDEAVKMQGGKNNVGKPTNVFTIILQMILKFFSGN